MVNIGTGKPSSVLEVIQAFKDAANINIPYSIVDRRIGDVGICFADPRKAKDLLDWQAQLTLDQMCWSSWNWQSKNPVGYSES